MNQAPNPVRFSIPDTISLDGLVVQTQESVQGPLATRHFMDGIAIENLAVSNEKLMVAYVTVSVNAVHMRVKPYLRDNRV